MSAQVRSLDVRRAPITPLPLSGTPEERALDWSFRMFRVFLGNPSAPTGLHDGVVTIVIPEDDPAVANLNLAAARMAERRGQTVAYRYLDSAGRPLGGVTRRFSIDLRDSTWGLGPRDELDGDTAAQLRTWFHAIIAGSQEGAPVGLSYDNIIVLNGVRIYLLDEPEPGLYTCLAFERDPTR